MSTANSVAQGTQKSGRVSNFFAKIKAMLRNIFSAILGRRTAEVHSQIGETKGQIGAITLGSVQAMAASPATIQVSDASATPSQATQNEIQTQVYVRPKQSPLLPLEHRNAVKKYIRAGNRRKAEKVLEQLGYASPQVSTRGGTAVVTYLGADGSSYVSKFRYK